MWTGIWSKTPGTQVQHRLIEAAARRRNGGNTGFSRAPPSAVSPTFHNLPAVSDHVPTGVALQGGRDLVYAGTLKGDLLAVDRLTGRQIWRTHLASLKTSCDDFPGGVVGILDT